MPINQQLEKKMSFSIVTVTLNSAKTLADTIASVGTQKDVLVQHIIKDGGSEDDTLNIARQKRGMVEIIEQKDLGIYDAMNQGFAYAKNDYVVFLNSDDYFSYEFALRDVENLFKSEDCDIVYGDIEIVDDKGKVTRHWKTGELNGGRLSGMQIPHPAFFVRRDALLKLQQPFDPKYKISSDFKQQLQLINELRLPSRYLKKTLVTMRSGGASSANIGSVVLGWKECIKAYQEVTGRSGLLFVASKAIRKLAQLRY